MKRIVELSDCRIVSDGPHEFVAIKPHHGGARQCDNVTVKLVNCCVVGFVVFLLVLFNPTQAQSLSGVGALVDQVSSGPTYLISGKHAPFSEVVVADGADKVVAAAKVESLGDFSFQFRVDPDQVGNIFLFGIDQAGVTNKLAVPAGGVVDILLPPTLVQDVNIDLGNDGVALGGYSYPGASVVITLTKSGDEVEEVVEIAEADGGWRHSFDRLSSGNYEVTAVSRLGSMISAESQVLSFLILPAAASAIVDVGDAVGSVVRDLLPSNVSEAAAAIAPQADAVGKVVAPVVGAGALTQILLGARNFGVFLFQIFFSLLQFFGIRKKANPWGVVYDGLTKQPLSFAIVRLYELGEQMKLIATDVTGDGGVFSFFPQAGAYIIKVSKAGYNFPSKLVSGTDDGEYAHIYHGEQVKFQGDESVVSVSVPVDPKVVKIDWKFRVIRFLRERLPMLTTTSLIIGLVMSLVAVVGGQGGLNSLFLVFYVVMMSVQGYNVYKDKYTWGRVLDQQSEPVSGVELSLMDSVFDRLVQRRITSSLGKYQFVVPPGKYKIVVASTGYELAKGVKNAYEGQEIVVVGEKPKLVALRIVVDHRS